MMQEVDSVIPVPIFKVDKNLEILGCTREATEWFGQPQTLLQIIDEGSHEKILQMLHPSKVKNTFEVNIVDKFGELLLVDCYAGWQGDLHAELLFLKKDPTITRVSTSLNKLQSRLQATDMELLQEKEKAEEVLKENNRLSAPFIEVTNELALIPIFGEIDTEKSEIISELIIQNAYDAIATKLIIDFTAIGRIDRDGLKGFNKLFRSLEMLGKQVTVTGVGPRHAKTFHELGVPMDIHFLPSLQKAITKLTK
ncbi:STAS domain-containing protein [Virgibacillus halodenitrificans]|nr:STAS domain-containing protein [Virgibacillus halodenitrificans]